MEPITPIDTSTKRPGALLGWRLLALAYDLWPALALWMLVASLFTAAYALTGHADRENIAPFSSWQWLLWLCCWLVTGAYATISWRRGGQTLGMRPWRLALEQRDEPPGWKQLWVRYAVGTASLLAGGIGFWWALIDSSGQTWHDRASGLRMRRMMKGERHAVNPRSRG